MRNIGLAKILLRQFIRYLHGCALCRDDNTEPGAERR